MLETLGLSSTADTIYRTMLAQPTWGVAELVLHTGLSEIDVRGALDALAEMALVYRSRDEPDRLQPASPEIGLAVLVARAEAQVAQRQHEIAATRAAIAALAAAHEATPCQDVLIRLDSLDAVRQRLEQLAATARVECMSFNPGAAHRPDAMAASKPLNQVALERGVRIRAIYQESFRNDPPTLAYARWLTDLGGETRTVPIIPLQMVIVDRELALVPIDSADPRVGAVEVRSQSVVTALCVLFEQVWLGATPFGRAPSADTMGLDPLERDLLRLLGEGNTDESAARKLSLSVRTIQRMMADLMNRLGADSRFQAGANAVRQGWL